MRMYRKDREVGKRYSVAEARANLPLLLDQVEKGGAVELTRRGKPVAALVPIDVYQRHLAKGPDLWAAIGRFRATHDLSEVDVDSLLEATRSPDPGRDIDL